MNDKLKSNLITVAKILFEVGIIAYMIITDKLDLKEIAQITQKQALVFKTILAFFAVYTLATIRWYSLLKWQGLPTTFNDVLRINCIGLFFNNFMPGSVGGDLIKAYYIAKENRDHRTRAVTTIIIDRIIGFEALMMVAFVALFLNYNIITSNPQLGALASAIGLYIGLSLLGAAAVFSKRIKKLLKKIGIKKIITFLPKHELLFKVYDAFHIYADQKKKIALCLLITLPVSILNVFIFYNIGREMGEHSVSLASYFTAIPAGLLMLSLPVAPAGIGVGQGAFYKLFEWFGAESGRIGSTMISVYHIIMISINTFFVFVYLKNKKDVNRAMDQVRKATEQGN